MKNFFLMFSFVLSLNSGFAVTSKVDLLVQDLKYASIVENLSPQEMNGRLMQQIQKRGIVFNDLENYLIANGNDELLSKIELYASDVNDSFASNNFNYSSELIKSFLANEIPSEKGANYSGCGAVISLGATAIVGSIVLGLLALEEAGYFQNCDGICIDNTNEERVRDLSVGAGVAGVVGLTLVLAGSGGC
jgi:hypothetical protein